MAYRHREEALSSRRRKTKTKKVSFGADRKLVTYYTSETARLFTTTSYCCVVLLSVSTIGGGGDTTISSPGRSPKQPLPGIGLRHPHTVGKFAPNSTHFTRGLVKYIPSRGCFRAVPSQNGYKIVTSPPPPLIAEPVYCSIRLNQLIVKYNMLLHAVVQP